LRTTETTDTENKRGEVNKLELGWTKNKIAIGAYDVQPKFSKYVFRDYPFEGLSYRREGKIYTITGTIGKAMKELRSSDYARYLGGLRVERSFQSPRPHSIGVSVAQTRDTGSVIDLKKMNNLVYEADMHYALVKPWVIKGEMASGANSITTVGSTRGTARTVELNYLNRASTGKIITSGPATISTPKPRSSLAGKPNSHRFNNKR